ncbi:tRNA1(Val) (adenine(37)-N6)-methyltransferase [Sutcliffiella horikoshii]|uniref:tRNA1(Val) (adenine(37)-N6)-methyltransferase n=1 Tax=Sutcliffiella horikoshii TaxID=79883 RepID=UPI003CEED6B6
MKEVDLIGDERLDYLLAENLRIIQSPSVFSFSLDAVLLAQFVYVPIQKGNIMDLCTGNGIIPLLLSKRTRGNITGVEIQERLAGMAERSFSYNRLEDRLKIINMDLKELPAMLENKKYDVVTCNPPYFPLTEQEEKINSNIHYAIARHEIECTLEDVVRVCSQITKQGGKVAFVHRPGRLLDIISLMRKYRIEPKRLQFVHSKLGKPANTLLIEGIKDGNPDLKILPPLLVYDEKGEYTPEVRKMLFGEEQV